MKYSRKSAIECLLKSYKTYYNITETPQTEENIPLVAFCEFYERSEKYVLSRKAELWSANCEEFIYLFETEHLTLEMYERCRDFAKEDGMKHAHIGPDHMYTYITPVFICDSCEEDARKALKKCRIYQSFHFSFHGWMDFHAAVLEVDTDRISTNRSGKCVEKIMKKVLYTNQKRRTQK